MFVKLTIPIHFQDAFYGRGIYYYYMLAWLDSVIHDKNSIILTRPGVALCAGSVQTWCSPLGRVIHRVAMSVYMSP